MKTPEEYLDEVRSLINRLRLFLNPEEVAEIENLVNHDEPAEGLRTLAWIIYDEQKNVGLDVIAEILYLIDGMIPIKDLPPNFASNP